MKMPYVLICLACSFFLFGCALGGPAPDMKGYSHAVKGLPFAKTAKYTMRGSWHPNTLVDSVGIDTVGTSGRLFVTPEKLVFAVFDKQTSVFLKAFEVSYSNTNWITVKEQGVLRIIRLQTNDSIHSFGFSEGVDSGGQAVDRDEIVKYVIGRL
ncbi:MAG: hypothetical protein ISR50_07295 [Alphaproteobacteria bacterium]|nr:hypothetical protein [Alphaproteobacteria bacterium]